MAEEGRIGIGGLVIDSDVSGIVTRVPQLGTWEEYRGEKLFFQSNTCLIHKIKLYYKAVHTDLTELKR
jgi:hypothetical protein